MLKKIKLGFKDIVFDLKQYRVSKSIKIILRRDGKLTVTAPLRLGERAIAKFILKKEQWILAALDRLAALPARPTVDTRKKYLLYKKAAEELVQERLGHFNKFYGFSFNRISIRNQSTRWGSCSRQGNLNFNYKVALLPREQADYIIVHELCHLKEFNHSEKFWKLVAQTIPNYLSIRRELKKGKTLLF